MTIYIYITSLVIGSFYSFGQTLVVLISCEILTMIVNLIRYFIILFCLAVSFQLPIQFVEIGKFKRVQQRPVISTQENQM